MNDKKSSNNISRSLVCSIILLLFNSSIAIYSRVLCFFVFIYSPFGFIGCLFFAIVGVVKIFKKKKNGFLILLINLATITISISLILKAPPHYLTEKDLKVEGFHISPDEKNVVVEYMNGSRDGKTHVSLIPLKNKNEHNLSDYMLPDNCQYSKWLSADSVEFLAFPKNGTGPETDCGKSVNDIKIITRSSRKYRNIHE
ncbi:MAG: hypothetical protein K0R25_1279 [Rickettsiaceae bacterium]|jgi:hypothetical protein|nr:hypothetical protein [Rickettsiaceae bacterium]